MNYMRNQFFYKVRNQTMYDVTHKVESLPVSNSTIILEIYTNAYCQLFAQ